MVIKSKSFSQTKFVLVATFAILISMFCIIFLDLDFGYIRDMGPGFLPKILIGISLVLTVAVVITLPDFSHEITLAPLLIPGSVIVFAWLATYAGVLWATALLTPVLILLWHRPGFFQVLMMTAVILAAVYVIFEILANL